MGDPFSRISTKLWRISQATSVNSLLKRRTIVAMSISILVSALVVLFFAEDSFDVTDCGPVAVRVQRTALLRSVSEGSYEITFISEVGVTNRVTLYHNLFECPTMLLHGGRSNVFFCVYNHDVDWQLIRIELNEIFQPLPKDSPIRNLVLGSTCRIEQVSKEEKIDWDFVANILEQMSSREFKRRVIASRAFRVNQKKLIASLRNFGDQGQYPGEVTIPSYIKSKSTLRTNG